MPLRFSSRMRRRVCRSDEQNPGRRPLPPRTQGHDERLPLLRPPAYAPRRATAADAVQPPLLVLEEVGA